MLRTDPSAGFPRAPALREVVDRFGMMVPEGFAVPVALGLLSSLGSELRLPPLSLPLSAFCFAPRGVGSSSIVCNRESSGVTGLVVVSLEGVDGLLAISWTVSKDGPCPLTPLVTAREVLRSTLPWSSDDVREVLLSEVFGGVDS